MPINSLDPSQKHALNAVMHAKFEDDLFLIYGPPGTGKSQLLVNLLFSLAVNRKRVLFVSQNTEALQVIERMIKLIEKSMGLPENHPTLADYCLRLYTKEHRYLKYIRNQSSRINERATFPPKDINTEITSGPNYNLAYVNLDKDKNYNVNKTELGIDELLHYFMKYVYADYAVEVVQGFNKIDLRTIVSLLDKYQYRNEFNFLNNPQNELRFVSQINSDVSLPDLYAVTEQVLNA